MRGDHKYIPLLLRVCSKCNLGTCITAKKDVGTGRGLWLSKEIVQKHGGSISVRSSIRPGRSGTLFFIPDR